MGHYRFSEGAAHDFDQIYDFGIDEFGLDQATKYQNRLKQRFSELAENLEASLDSVGIELELIENLYYELIE